jgi:hypothetical protein
MTMDARLDYLGSPLAMKFVKYINSAEAVLRDSALPAATKELAKLRASRGLPARPVRIAIGPPRSGGTP